MFKCSPEAVYSSSARGSGGSKKTVYSSLGDGRGDWNPQGGLDSPKRGISGVYSSHLNPPRGISKRGHLKRILVSFEIPVEDLGGTSRLGLSLKEKSAQGWSGEILGDVQIRYKLSVN